MSRNSAFRILSTALSLFILIMGLGLAIQAPDQQKLEMLASRKPRLNLSDDQVGQVKGLLGEMQGTLEPIGEQMEGFMNSEQWTAYEAFREKQKEENKAKMKQGK